MTIEEEINGMPNMLDPDTEYQLLCKRSLVARNTLLEHTLKAATRYASSLTRGLLPMDELVSLSATALLKAIEKYNPQKVNRRGPARLISYARPFIRHEISVSWRFRDPVDYGRRPIPEDPAESIELDTVAAEGGGPNFDQIDLNERWDLVIPHLRKLTELERRILILIFEARIPGPEIGRMLGCTRANIHEIRLRALKKIRHGLLKEGKLYL